MIPGFYTVDLFDCPPFQMFSADDCHRCTDIIDHKIFEPMSMKLWCALAREASGIVDIGAQVGVYSLAAASLRRDLPIEAFEPNPDAMARLLVNRRLNGFENIVPHRCALSDAYGYTKFTWKENGKISSGGRLGSPIKGLPIHTTTVVVNVQALNDVKFFLGGRGLIKIDVEGGEVGVLSGMVNFLNLKPDIILETFSQASCDAWNAAIKPLGYGVWKIHEHEMTIEPVSELTPCSVDGQDFNQFLSVRSPAEVKI